MKIPVRTPTNALTPNLFDAQEGLSFFVDFLWR
jgi:hypothetical protein